MLVIISPAKTLDYSPLESKVGFSEPSFISKSESLVKEMRNYCLLYTSPSPRDWMVSRMPSSA